MQKHLVQQLEEVMCTVSQFAEQNSGQMPSDPCVLCRAPNLIAAMASSKVTGCSKKSAVVRGPAACGNYRHPCQ